MKILGHEIITRETQVLVKGHGGPLTFIKQSPHQGDNQIILQDKDGSGWVVPSDMIISVINTNEEI